MYLIVDMGGTKTRIARVNYVSRFEEPVIFDTPADDAARAAFLIEKVGELAAGETLEAVLIGRPIYMKIAPFMVNQVSVPLYFENDAALVGLGEAHYGAGKGAGLFVYITVSTGINGVRTIHGALDVSHQGFEIGGQYLATEGTISLEDLISGRAVQAHYGVHPRELGKEHPFWEEAARILAYGVHNTVLHWSPERVAIGGSMMKEIGISVERVDFHLKQIMRKFPQTPALVRAELGDLGGLWGGLARLSQLSPASANADTLPK